MKTKINIRVRGIALDEQTFGDTILKCAKILGMADWRIAPGAVTLYPDHRAAFVDITATVGAMARKIGGRAKVSPLPRYHFEIVPRAMSDRRAAA